MIGKRLGGRPLGGCGLGSSLPGAPRRVLLGGGALPAYQQILDLASADGWTAVYDPSNPKARTLVGSKVSAIADGLGNLPNLAQGTDANRFTYLPKEFGQLDAMQGNGTSAYMATSAFSSALSQPTTIMCIGSLGADDHYMWDGIASGNRHAFYEFGGWGVYGGNTDADVGGGDTAVHVDACIYNGLSSRFRIDGVQTDAGNYGAHTLTGLTYGARFNAASWNDGKMGAVLIRNDANETKIATMETLLLTLGGLL